jgi:hypothetical protein
MLVQEKLKRDPFGGQIFVFRARRGYLLKADDHAVTWGADLACRRGDRHAQRF